MPNPSPATPVSRKTLEALHRRLAEDVQNEPPAAAPELELDAAPDAQGLLPRRGRGR